MVAFNCLSTVYPHSFKPLWEGGVLEKFRQGKQYYLYTKQITFHLMHSNIPMNIIIWGFRGLDNQGCTICGNHGNKALGH